MALCNHASSPPDHDLDASASPTPRAAPGFYKTRTSVFYATSDGRVYLVGTADEPVCLRLCAGLPQDAATAIDVRDPALHLVADTAENLARPIGLRLRAEVGRDARVIAAAMLQDLLASVGAEIGTLLLDEHPADPERLHERVGDLLELSRAHGRRLGDQRVNRRGEAPNLRPPCAGTPRVATPLRHRGEYLGCFTSMHLAGEALGAVSIRDAHLRGDLWTTARDGLLYVFRCPVGSP